MCAVDVAFGPRLSTPVFVAAAARSGSTLLRNLLDAHPQIVAPPESNLAAAANVIMEAWTLERDRASESERRQHALGEVRSLVRRYARYHCLRSGKELFCDKSLSTASHYEVLVDALPQARFIALHRHAMDMVASGIEASPWGFSGYGFERFVNPTNFVAGLVGYWCATTEQILALEHRLGPRCLRVQYERLVLDTDTVMQEVCAFLDVEWHDSLVADGFSRSHSFGPGDHKVSFTRRPHGDSIGRGIEVPADLLSRSLREHMNSSLALLGYPEVGEDWNFQSSPLRTARLPPSSDQSATRRLARLIRRHLGNLGVSSAAGWGEAEVGEVALVIEDRGRVHSWLIDFTSRSLRTAVEPPENCVTLFVSVESLSRIAAGYENPGVLVFRNQIRIRGGSGSERRRAVSQLHRALCGTTA